MAKQFENYMEEAFLEAGFAQDRGEVPVGAVIVDPKTKKIIARSGNQVMELKDPTGHAEIQAIREACSILRSERLPGFDLYVTLEPCAMCATAISFARLRRLYFGAEDLKMGGVLNGPKIFSNPNCHHAPEVYDGMGAARAKKLMQDFFKAKR
ncbi:MAG: nucleoside deaminase [Sphingomonadales bacterium]